MPRASSRKWSRATPSSLRTYRYAGLRIAADFAIPELPHDQGVPDLRLFRSDAAGGDRAWLHVWRLPSREAWMRIARVQDSYLVRFDRFGEFVVRARRIDCSPLPGVPMRTIRHLLLDQVLPAALASTDRLVVHASAVVVGRHAVAFLGGAGAGKSTLAAALVRSGLSLVTDDALVLAPMRHGIVAVPTYPGVRLWPGTHRLIGRTFGSGGLRVAHYNRKRRWAGAGVPFRDQPLPLSTVYVLGQGARSRVVSLPLRTGVLSLLQHAMLLDTENRRDISRGFEIATRLGTSVAVKRLLVGEGRRGVLSAIDAVVADQAASVYSIEPAEARQARG